MSNYKVFVISIIAISFIIQIGSLILDKTRYSKIFKLSSGIILLFSIFFCFNGFEKINYIPQHNTDENNYSSINLKNEFENNLKKLITDDLHNKNYVNINIDIETDLKTVKIYVYLKDIKQSEEVKKYLQNKYCTPNDEVIIVNEANSIY